MPPEILKLYEKNTVFFTHYPPFPTLESVYEDLKNTPNNVPLKNKIYVGFYDGITLIGVLDLILNYPNLQSVFIGLLMLATDVQNKGVGSNLYEEIESFIKNLGYKEIKLGYIETNLASKRFWERQGYLPTGETKLCNNNLIISMLKKL